MRADRADKVKTAMVLAAGLGTRMRPLTLLTPKPLIEIAGRSLIDRKIDLLVSLGIERVVVNTFYLPEQIEAQLAKRKDVEIIISREEERLETGGGVLNALHLLGEKPFIVTSSDVVYEDETGVAKLIDAHDPDGMGSMLLHPVRTAWGYEGSGDFDLNMEKITWKQGDHASHVFTTTQILNPHVFANPIIKSQPKMFSLREVYNVHLPQMKGVENCCKWYHVGTVDAVDALNNLLSA